MNHAIRYKTVFQTFHPEWRNFDQKDTSIFFVLFKCTNIVMTPIVSKQYNRLVKLQFLKQKSIY
jgi:hypothetical protein